MTHALVSRRFPRLALAFAVGLLAAGTQVSVHAADSAPYGLQYRQPVTFTTGLASATTEGATLAQGAIDAPNFHMGEYAIVYTPCSDLSEPTRECLDHVLTEVPTQVWLDSVDTDGTVVWEPVNDWPLAPPTRIESRLFWPGGIAADLSGRVYVADSNNHRIAVFDSAGTGLFTLGTFGQIYSMLDYPDPAGDCYDALFYTVDPSQCPGDPTKLLGRFFLPTDVAVTPDGQTIYVADDLNHRIQVFRRNDAAVLTADTTVVASNGWRFTASEIGGFGKSQVNNAAPLGRFSSPISVDAKNGRLAISDFDNGRMVVLDPSASGSIMASDGQRYSGFSFGHPGNSTTPIQDELNHARDVKIAPDGRIVVADSENNQVKVFTSTGVGVAIIGSNASFEAGHFKYPDGVDVFPNGDVIVADADNGRLQLITRTATGYAVGTDQFASVSSPNGVVITPGGRLAVSEFNGHDVVGLGQLGLRVTSVMVPSPAQIAAGDPTAISFVATNSGATEMTGVTPLLTGAAAAACAPGSYPGDSGPATLAVGQSHTFTVCATGNVPDSTITARVSASGTWSGFMYQSPEVSAPAFTVRGLDRASLLLNGSAPASSPIGSTFTVTLAVTNNGNVPLTNLLAAFTPNNLATLQPGAVTSAAQLAVGETKNFTATYKAVTEGTFDVTATMSAAEIDPAPAPVTVHVSIRADSEPPQFLSFTIHGPAPTFQLPNANGWVQDPFDLGATVDVRVADQGSAGLAFVRYAILSQQTGAAVLQPGVPSAAFTTIPIHAKGQGRVLVAFWADDTAGNGRAAGLYPGAATGVVSTAPTALLNFCNAVPQQCVMVNVDTEVPALDQERIEVSADRTQARVFFNAKDGQSDVEKICLGSPVPQCVTATASTWLEMEPSSTSRGALVLTSHGADVFGIVTVIDHAGFVNQFSLPFRGPNDPPLRLDSTPPEAFNRLDPAALGQSCVKTGPGNVPLFTYFCTNKVYGTDNLPGLTTAAFAPSSVVPIMWGNGDNSEGDAKFDGIAELHTTTFTDEYTPSTGPKPVQFPNSVKLVEKVRQQGQEARVRVISYQYNNGPIITPDWAYKKYEWSNTVQGTFKTLNQKFEIGRGLDRIQVLANWDASKNQTTITELGPGPQKKITVTGLILLRMTTASGKLRIEYNPNSPVPPPPPMPGKK